MSRTVANVAHGQHDRYFHQYPDYRSESCTRSGPKKSDCGRNCELEEVTRTNERSRRRNRVLVSDTWNLIIRWITPIIYQPLPAPSPLPQIGVSGLGDMQPTFLLSPRKPHELIWGVGPIIQMPTATSRYLGQGKLALGPNVVALMMPGHFVLGVLVNNIWSVAGGGSRPDINQLLLQYFVNYNMKKGWYLSTSPILTANWNTPASSGSVWTVPFGGGVGRIMKLGFQPVNISLQAYGNAVHVPGASPWGVRATFALLFPKLTKEQQKMMLEQKLKQME